MEIYRTEVISIGRDAAGFLGEKMLILFGEKVPAELKDYCYNIYTTEVMGNIEPGMHLSFNDVAYKITAVGAEVNDNLASLGHITVNFDGSDTPELPGTLYVEDVGTPEINVGDQIIIN